MRPGGSDARMTDPHAPTGHHADEALSGPHGAGDHGDDGEHDDHAHAEERLGPIDVVAWTFSIVGVGLGLLIAFGFALATGYA